MPEGTGIGFGIGDWITGQINSWFASLVYLAIKPLLDLLAVTLLATPDVSGSGRVFDLWKATAAIANTGFVLLATVGAISAMGHQTVQTRFAVKEVLPRLFIAVLAANTSFLLCGKVIEIANALSTALLGQDFDGRRAATTLQLLIIAPGASHQIFYVLLALVAVVLLLLLLITFVMRAALVLLLTVASPLALACLALPYAEGLARFWWRAFTGLLLIQVAQSLTLVLAVRIFFNQDGRLLLGLMPTGQLVNLVLALCLLIILIRIPGWISRRIFAGVGGHSTIGRMVKYALAYKLTSPVLAALHLRPNRRRSSTPQAAGNVAAAHAMTSRALPALAAGPVGTAAATAGTAASAARGGPGPAKHAPSAPAVQGKYRRPPRPSGPVPPTTPVYGHPRETYYANGAAGLTQMYRLRTQNSPSRPARPPVPPVMFRPPVYPSQGVTGCPGDTGEHRTSPPNPTGDEGR
ncbi:conjugal transfer protein TrbL family protein [Microbispora siamensis]